MYPIISIYITNKNYSQYLSAAIRSAINQTFKNKEIIIIDDASTDKSRVILKKYEKHKLCRVIYNDKSKGLSGSSNIAINAAKGEYVMRLDADDTLHKDCLNIHYNEIIKSKTIILTYSAYYQINKRNEIIGLENQINYGHYSQIRDKPILAACCLIRKDALQSVNFYNENIKSQDGYDLWYKLIINKKIKYINLPLFNYRKHDHNLTKNKLELFKNRSKIINKFSKIKSKKKLNIICVVPIRDHEKDKSISPFFKINKIKIIDLNLKEILKVKNIDKIIVSTDSKKIIQYVHKKYKKKIAIHIRKKNQSGINQSYKLAVIDAIKNNSKKRVDILLIIHLNYPIKNKIYIEQAIDMTILHETDLTISSKPEIWNNYYIQKNSTLELIGNDNNSNLRFEKKIIYKECGGIYSYNYESFLKNKLKKISNVIIDDVSSLMINNLDDLKKLNKINSKLKIEKKLID